jgi:hypothetical protein
MSDVQEVSKIKIRRHRILPLLFLSAFALAIPLGMLGQGGGAQGGGGRGGGGRGGAAAGAPAVPGAPPPAGGPAAAAPAGQGRGGASWRPDRRSPRRCAR